jgi:hypothetical protein
MFSLLPNSLVGLKCWGMISHKQASTERPVIDGPTTVQTQLRIRPELVPEPLWGRSGSNLLSRKDWGAIRIPELEKARHCCAVCSIPGPGLICHEQWAYDDDLRTATLSGFEVHCKSCDLVTHMGRAMSHGMGDQAIAQFCLINKATPSEAERVYQEAFRLWQKRSRATWSLRVAEAVLQQYPQLSALVETGSQETAPSAIQSAANQEYPRSVKPHFSVQSAVGKLMTRGVSDLHNIQSPSERLATASISIS